MNLLTSALSTNPYIIAAQAIPWKLILIGLTIIAILVTGFVFHAKYKNALSEVETLKKDIKIEKLEVVRLTASLKDANESNTMYIDTLGKIQTEKNRIQFKYNELMERIRNAKLEVDKNGTIANPYTVIPGGVPVETRSSSHLP